MLPRTETLDAFCRYLHPGGSRYQSGTLPDDFSLAADPAVQPSLQEMVHHARAHQHERIQAAGDD